MFERILDWFLPPISTPEEQAANRTWLQLLVVSALGAIAIYLVLNSGSMDVRHAAFLGLLAVFLLGMLFALHRGQVRLESSCWSMANLAAMLAASYVFGGVRSNSHFGTVVALVIIAMFLRGWVTIVSTLLTIAFGGLLVWGEMRGWYAPPERASSALTSWGNASLIFIVVTLLIGAARRTVRGSFERSQREIEERRKAEAALQEQTRYLAALHETALAIINRLEVGHLARDPSCNRRWN